MVAYCQIDIGQRARFASGVGECQVREIGTGIKPTALLDARSSKRLAISRRCGGSAASAVGERVPLTMAS